MPLYFIAILPSPEIADQARSIQNEFAKNYDSKRQLRLPVHLTLVPPFRKTVDFEEKMISSLQDFAKEQHPFEIHLNDFGAFSKKVIYIDVQENEDIKKLYQNLNSWLTTRLHLELSESGMRFNPHVTVANRDLKLSAFNKAWPKFEKRKFSASFDVKSIYLLKHNGSVWEVFRAFRFGFE